MKNKLQYLIIIILFLSNIFFILNYKKKPGIYKNIEFKREMNYLKNRINFDKNQLKLAKKEYQRYDSVKNKIEKRFRRYDLIIMDDIFNKSDSNHINMRSYYDIAIQLNEEKMKHWKKIREISNEKQVKKLDSIWEKIKKRISNANKKI